VAITFVIGVMISAITPLGLRTDLDHVDVIKSLPIPSQVIVWGSIGASIAYVLIVQCAALAAMAWALGGWSLAMSGALALAVPLNLLTVATDSVLVLMFPSIRRFVPGDVLVGVRIMLVNFAKVVLAILAALVAGLALLAGRLLLPEVPLAGFIAAWLVLVLEGLAAVGLAGWLFSRYDVSEHVLEGE
jgi:hypothetical protein